MTLSGVHIYNDYNKRGQESDVKGWDVADLGVGGTGVVAAIWLASNPVGWVIGAGATVYFTGRFIYQETHKHK